MTDDSSGSETHPEPAVVAVYPDRGEAEVTRAHLEASGIRAFIDDEVEGGLMTTEGEDGVKVVVRGNDAEAARAVLGSAANE